MPNTTISEETVFVDLRISLWSGLLDIRSLTSEDAAEIRSAVIPSLGKTLLCPPTRLASLAKIGRTARRECERVCIRFFGGYATDEMNAPALIKRLEEHKRQFDEEVSALIAGLPAAMHTVIAQQPQWKGLIEKLFPDVSVVRKRCQFTFQVIGIGKAESRVRRTRPRPAASRLSRRCSR